MSVRLELKNTDVFDITIKPYAKRFYSDESSYGIYMCYNMGKDYDIKSRKNTDIFDEVKYKLEKITVVGTMPELVIGKEYKITATKGYHKTYGDNYTLVALHTVEITKDDEWSLLEELVSPSMFKKITDVYPKPISSLLDGTFVKSKIKGMQQKQYDNLIIKAKEFINYAKALTGLSKFGISFSIIKKLVKQYKSPEVAIKTVMNDPYVLYRDIKGIGFKTADEIATSIGLEPNCSQRKFAGIIYALELSQNLGNTWADKYEIKETAERVLDTYIPDFDDIIQNEIFYVKDNMLSMIHIYNCEVDIALELQRLSSVVSLPPYRNDAIQKEIQHLETLLNIQYTDEQKELFYRVNSNNVVILTGYAGTGKTTLLNGCLKMLENVTQNILLVSPTAKASKVLAKSTGRNAMTIHRALITTPMGFFYKKDNQKEMDIIVIDEASMIDIFLFRHLLFAIPDGCKVVIVGDPAQLESISVGNILQDLITSEMLPVVKLETVFRQALDSGILSVATQVRSGEKFYSSKDETLEIGVNKDFKAWFSTKEDCCDKILKLYKKCIENTSLEDILVISPMKKGYSGVQYLNNCLQQIANPPDDCKPEFETKRCKFRLGDKVRHTKNDYRAIWYDDMLEPIEDKLGVFNGDFGVIKHIYNDTQTMYVDYGDKIIKYSTKKLAYVDLAYAITCHSSQGSQANVVIGCMDMSHYMNLKRNLLYTMITRASETIYMVIQQKACNMALANNSVAVKKTFLSGIMKVLLKK